MSNLLNKKRILDRGPKITPAQEFKLEAAPATESEESKVPDTNTNSIKKTTTKSQNKSDLQTISSVRLTKATRNKLNALVQMGRAENVDILLDILLDEYITNHLLKEDKRMFEMIVELLANRKN